MRMSMCVRVCVYECANVGVWCGCMTIFLWTIPQGKTDTPTSVQVQYDNWKPLFAALFDRQPLLHLRSA